MKVYLPSSISYLGQHKAEELHAAGHGQNDLVVGANVRGHVRQR
jgi:hypothetical protein